MTDITLNAAGVSDVNPYVLSSDWTILSDGIKVQSQAFRARFNGNGFLAFVATTPVTTGLLDVTFTVLQTSAGFSDGSGAVFLNAAKTGYYVEVSDTHVYVRNVTAGTIGSSVGNVASLTYATGAEFRATLEISTGNLRVYQSSVSTVTPILSINALTYSAGMSCGGGVKWANNNSAGLKSISANIAAATPAVTLTGGSIAIGGTGAITVSNMGTILSGTIGGVALASANSTAITMPTWAVGQAAPICGSGVTLSVSDGTLSASTTVTVTPLAGYNAVTLSGLIEDSYSVHALGVDDGDQFYSTFTTSANGDFSAADGTYTCYARKSGTGLIESSIATIQDGAIVSGITGNITRSITGAITR